MPAVMKELDRMTTAEKVEVMNYLWNAVAASGEAFVPVWRIASGDEPKPAGKRRLGGFEKGFYMAQDFDEPLEDFAEYM